MLDSYIRSAVHPRLSIWRELKCGASCLDKPKIQISEGGNLSCLNDYVSFKLGKICHIMWFEKERKENNFQHKPIR